MLRALVSRLGGARRARVPLLGEPRRLVSGTTILAVGETTRRDIEIRLGPGVAYPAPGWHTWTVTGPKDETWLLSAFFRDRSLIAVEFYIGKTGNVPRYAPRARGVFRVQPDELELGQRTRSLPSAYVSTNGRAGSVGSIVYQDAFEARWASGVALVSGNDGRVERIALYIGA